MTKDFVTERLKLKDLYPERAEALAKEHNIDIEDLELVKKGVISEKIETVEKERAVISFINMETVDRVNEIIDPDGAILKHYNKTVPYGHDYRGLPMGKSMWIKKATKKGKKGLLAKTIFLKRPAINEELYHMFTDDVAGTGPVLNSWSIGFIPLKWEDAERKGEPKEGEADTRPRRKYTKWELLEYSGVMIPSNREALTEMVAKGLIKSEKLKGEIIECIGDECAVEGLDNDYDNVVYNSGDLVKETITKPEENDDFIRIPVRDCKVTATITISEKQGITALYCGKIKKIRTYIFNKKAPYNWTLKKAQAWVKRHGKQMVYECVVCGKLFLDWPSNKRKTCSTKCGYKYLSQLNSKENHPQWKGGKEKRICEQCGKVFEVDRKGNSQKYCSKECHNKAMEVEKETGICPICGKEFTYYLNYPQIYCSRQCFYKGNAEFLKNLNKNRQLSEAQLEALGKGRLNGLAGHKTECDDGHIVQSKSEAEFDNWLYEEDINHNIQVRVCSDRYWTCDFVLIRDDGETLWIEIDGMGKIREEFGIKRRFEEKISYYKNNDFDFMVIDKENAEENKEEIKKWIEKAKYNCECIKCGWPHTSEKHCNTYKCEKCGGTMRRVGRPGPGQESTDNLDSFDFLKDEREDIYSVDNGEVVELEDNSITEEAQKARNSLKDIKLLSEEELKDYFSLFKEMFPEFVEEPGQTEEERIMTVSDVVEEQYQRLREEVKSLKEGRVLSSKNRKLIQDCLASMEAAIPPLKTLLTATEPPQREEFELEVEEGKKEEKNSKDDEKTQEIDLQPEMLADKIQDILKTNIDKLIQAKINKARGKVE